VHLFRATLSRTKGRAVAESTARILDEYLVAAARAGDRRAFGLLAGRWHGKLVAHGWRLTGNPEMARDAAQAAWVEIVRGLHRLADERAFPAWAYRIVSRRCAKQIADAVRRRELAAQSAVEPEPEIAEPGGALDAGRLRAAIARLPREQSSAIALFYLEEMSVAEVAVALDVPVGTVKTRLLHARRKLRDALEGE
jgi:RNA polymerase sigma factor (sigma-70 family)